jgi:hypothetical protein
MTIGPEIGPRIWWVILESGLRTQKLFNKSTRTANLGKKKAPKVRFLSNCSIELEKEEGVLANTIIETTLEKELRISANSFSNSANIVVGITLSFVQLENASLYLAIRA